MADISNSSSRQGILSLAIRDINALYLAYIPFVLNGGLFIPTKREFQLGDEVFMLISLIDEPERLPVAGKVIWITPAGAEGNRITGVGVQFNDQDGGNVRTKIETYLAGMLGTERATHTM